EPPRAPGGVAVLDGRELTARVLHIRSVVVHSGNALAWRDQAPAMRLQLRQVRLVRMDCHADLERNRHRRGEIDDAKELLGLLTVPRAVPFYGAVPAPVGDRRVRGTRRHGRCPFREDDWRECGLPVDAAA